MNVIILAAGEGKRLMPLTKNKPKGLVEIGGKSILERQIEIYHDLGLEDITIITGYKSKMIKFKNINYINNSNFKKTNMVHSLFCGENKIQNSTIISYGDIIFEKRVIKKLINSKHDISIIVDKAWKEYWDIRFKEPLDDAESLTIKNGYITDIGQKIKEIEKIQAQFIGLIKFQNDGIKFLKEFYKYSKELSYKGPNFLNEKVPFNQSYMTDLLQGMINFGYKLKAIPIKKGWIELDSLNDYQLYEKLDSINELNKFIKIKKN